jgi:hypothetical protein
LESRRHVYETAGDLNRIEPASGTSGRQGNRMTDPSDSIGECAGCELRRPLDDTGLCEECAARLDRDMIRERAWEYSATAFFHYDPQDYETLREKVIAEYGPAYELILPEGAGRRRRRGKKGRKRKPEE